MIYARFAKLPCDCPEAPAALKLSTLSNESQCSQESLKSKIVRRSILINQIPFMDPIDRNMIVGISAAECPIERSGLKQFFFRSSVLLAKPVMPGCGARRSPVLRKASA